MPALSPRMGTGARSRGSRAFTVVTRIRRGDYSRMAERAGLEPVTSGVTGRRSDQTELTFRMVPRPRLELGTADYRSAVMTALTNEAHGASERNRTAARRVTVSRANRYTTNAVWWAVRDSNPRPCACKAPALPAAPTAHDPHSASR